MSARACAPDVANTDYHHQDTLPCLNHSTSTRSDSFTTIGYRSNRSLNRPSYQREFQTYESQCSTGPVSTRSATSGGTGPTSCSRAMSASICNSWRHGSWRVAIFQLTSVVGIRPPKLSLSVRALGGCLQSRRPDCLPAQVRTPQGLHRAPRYRRKRSVCPSLSESCRGALTAER